MRALMCLWAMMGCGSPGESGPGAFAGSYDVTWNSNARITSPPGVPDQPYSVSGVMTIAATGGHDFIISNTANDCTGTFDRNGDSATSDPGDQPCDQTLTNGAEQHSTSNCTASIAGNALSIRCSGNASGVNAGGVPYTATWTGEWSGTRR